MKVTFITNYMTHHQLPFCQEMYKILGDDFACITTNSMENERKNMGWELNNDKYPFIHEYENNIYDDLILDGEIVILGGTHPLYLGNRLERKKITFRYFERLYKTGTIKAYIPSSYKRNVKEHTAHKDDPVYLLCAGGYVAHDFSIFKAYPDKMLKWGYFTEFEALDIEAVIQNKKSNEILWTGRMIDWKYGIQAVKAMKLLKSKNVKAHLTMVGEGEMREGIQKFILENDISDMVTIMDFMAPEKIREQMKQASIYLMTSNGEEGWGAVVNEAMNAGCAVIASYGAGSVPFLIQHENNGLVYDYKNVKELADNIERLLNDKMLRAKLGANAYGTIASAWNPKEAANRLIKLCEGLVNDNALVFNNDGPLSKAYDVPLAKGYKKCKAGEWV